MVWLFIRSCHFSWVKFILIIFLADCFIILLRESQKLSMEAKKKRESSLNETSFPKAKMKKRKNCFCQVSMLQLNKSTANKYIIFKIC